MTDYIDAIRNSSLSHVDVVHGVRGPAWTHVWAHVDTWFDAQSPRRVVDRVLIHAACALRRSVLSYA
jgi:hypothetical protein